MRPKSDFNANKIHHLTTNQFTIKKELKCNKDVDLANNKQLPPTAKKHNCCATIKKTQSHLLLKQKTPPPSNQFTIKNQNEMIKLPLVVLTTFYSFF